MKLSSNPETSGRYHTDWLNMMYPRLKLARNLLTDDGVIFISIDEHEINNLLNLCNDIFGEFNFIENFIWIKNSTKNLSKTTSTNHEYIVCYCKNKDVVEEKQIFRKKKECLDEVYSLLNIASSQNKSLSETQEILRKFYKDNPNLKGISMYNNIELDSLNKNHFQVYRLSDISAPKSTGKSATYDVIHPITNKKCKVPSRGWGFTEETMKEHIKNNLIYFYDDETHVPQFKRYLNNVETEVIKSTFKDFTEGKKELITLFGEAYFDNAKPTTLFENFMNVHNDSLILDFFSGSSTIAHSIMKFNAKDNGNRKFILVQIAEEANEKSEAFKAGYENICEIGKERIRRAGDKIKSKSNNNDLDIGFKVFKLDSSNLNKWDPDYDNVQQKLLDSVDNVISGRSELDLVYEIMIKYGIDLSLAIEEYNCGKWTIYSVGYGALLVCLDNNITKEIADFIIKLKNKLDPLTLRVVFKDNGFKSDCDKTNIKETLKINDIDEFITI
ncbi:MAG: site-specific DNA-methyltransferase [Methanobrevibacter sp.]|nr:site-specific DNA-methyltransferase [Candidatus Methanoflexus mossambicus]